MAAENVSFELLMTSQSAEDAITKVLDKLKSLEKAVKISIDTSDIQRQLNGIKIPQVKMEGASGFDSKAAYNKSQEEIARKRAEAAMYASDAKLAAQRESFAYKLKEKELALAKKNELAIEKLKLKVAAKASAPPKAPEAASFKLLNALVPSVGSKINDLRSKITGVATALKGVSADTGVWAKALEGIAMAGPEVVAAVLAIGATIGIMANSIYKAAIESANLNGKLMQLQNRYGTGKRESVDMFDSLRTAAQNSLMSIEEVDEAVMSFKGAGFNSQESFHMQAVMADLQAKMGGGQAGKALGEAFKRFADVSGGKGIASVTDLNDITRGGAPVDAEKVLRQIAKVSGSKELALAIKPNMKMQEYQKIVDRFKITGKQFALATDATLTEIMNPSGEAGGLAKAFAMADMNKQIENLQMNFSKMFSMGDTSPLMKTINKMNEWFISTEGKAFAKSMGDMFTKLFSIMGDGAVPASLLEFLFRGIGFSVYATTSAIGFMAGSFYVVGGIITGVIATLRILWNTLEAVYQKLKNPTSKFKIDISGATQMVSDYHAKAKSFFETLNGIKEAGKELAFSSTEEKVRKLNEATEAEAMKDPAYAAKQAEAARIGALQAQGGTVLPPVNTTAGEGLNQLMQKAPVTNNNNIQIYLTTDGSPEEIGGAVKKGVEGALVSHAAMMGTK